MKFLFFSLLCILPMFMVAQGSRLAEAIEKYDSGEIIASYSIVDEILNDPSSLKTKNLIKARFLRVQCIRKIYFENQTENRNARDKYRSILFKGKDDLDWISEQKTDLISDSEFNTEVEFYSLYFKSESVQLLNMSYDEYGNTKKAILMSSVDHASASLELRKDYATYDIRSQAFLNLGDTVSTLSDLESAVDLFNSSKPETPDYTIAYSYYRKSVLERYFIKDNNKSLATVQRGIDVLEEERKRAINFSGWTEYVKNETLLEFDQAESYLTMFELDLYMNTPELLSEALVKFEKALKNDPRNYSLRVAYANLLESVDINKAIAQYKLATEIDPNNSIAWFNIGAIYVNQAAEYTRLANQEEDFSEKQNELYKKAEEVLNLAKEPFEKCFAIDPKNLEVIMQLKTIAIQQGDMEAYEMYKNKEADLRY